MLLLHKFHTVDGDECWINIQEIEGITKASMSSGAVVGTVVATRSGKLWLVTESMEQVFEYIACMMRKVEAAMTEEGGSADGLQVTEHDIPDPFRAVLDWLREEGDTHEPQPT